MRWVRGFGPRCVASGWCRLQRSLLLPNHLAPVTDPHDDDHDAPVDDLGDHAVVAEPVLPETAEFIAAQSLAQAARVGQRSDSLAQKLRNAASRRLVELVELVELGELDKFLDG